MYTLASDLFLKNNKLIFKVKNSLVCGQAENKKNGIRC